MAGLFDSMFQPGGLGGQQSGGLGGFQDLAGALGPALMVPRAQRGPVFGALAQNVGVERQKRNTQNMTAQFLLKRGIAKDPEEAMAIVQQPGLMSLIMKDGGNEFSKRAEAAAQYGLDPSTPEGKAFILTGDIASAGGGGDYAKRQAAAEQFGLKPEDPAYQGFILTGKMPREDQGPLTQTDKKAILEADEMVSANRSAIDALTKAESLSENANSGWFAGARASVGNNLPDWMVPDQVSSPDSSQATADMDNAIVGQALTQLRTIFGGNPTEGERSILLELQGSSSMPADVRKKVFQRAREMAQKRLAFNEQRASELRGGSYYKEGGMGGGLPADTIPTPGGGGGWTVEKQ